MSSPLADRIRPSTLDEMVGQKHLIGEGKSLRKVIESGDVPNLIFYGPSGTGKTTLATIIANKTDKTLRKLNCTTASTADIKHIIGEIGTFAAPNGILLYLDEIQYFNKKQQQSLLEYIENGGITLIASTTENPYFYVYNALLSRSSVFEFKPVTKEEVIPAVKRGFKILSEEKGVNIIVSDEICQKISAVCGGDVRKAMNITELCVNSGDITEDGIVVTEETVEDISASSPIRYDRSGDEHYDCISAFQKSMRGSDPDAALHYLARILASGDMASACRRLMVCACEDVGLAYPQIMPIVKSAVDIALQVGMPEARIPLANAVVLTCMAPKSNAAYMGINEAMQDVERGNIGPVPRQLQNVHFDGEDAEVKGQHYLYPHDYPDHYVKQQYLPDRLKNKTYYVAGDNKNEQAFAVRLKEIKEKNK
ncbi:MAG: replication-associated recombination protein A [Clostridia bacterium]|nr:replication-associated recombination protein A [Clostridia bacterium]